jgi:hypothetical protein
MLHIKQVLLLIKCCTNIYAEYSAIFKKLNFCYVAQMRHWNVDHSCYIRSVINSKNATIIVNRRIFIWVFSTQHSNFIAVWKCHHYSNQNDLSVCSLYKTVISVNKLCSWNAVDSLFTKLWRNTGLSHSNSHSILPVPDIILCRHT